MRHLVYCILRADPPWRGRLPLGVAGAAVLLVTDGELAAAVSRGLYADGTPDAAQATAYADVIASVSTDRTVLPLRYGCLFPSRPEVRAFLRTRGAEFSARLDDLAGCVEMGVRALLVPTARPACAPRGATECGSGAAYLTARRAAYALRDTEHEAAAATAATIRYAFRSLSVRSRTGPAVLGQERLVSLYFLVRRADVGAFRAEFRRLPKLATYRLLLSGPWAPYSFVADQELGAVR